MPGRSYAVLGEMGKFATETMAPLQRPGDAGSKLDGDVVKTPEGFKEVYTALAEGDVFYFGNAVGESGNSATDAKVDAFDMAGIREHYGALTGPAAIRDAFDYNRDLHIDDRDRTIARDHQSHFLNALKLITVPPGDQAR